MKKKLITLLAMICAGALLVGCTAKTSKNDKKEEQTDSAKDEADFTATEYIKIKKYIGLEVEDVAIANVTDADVEASIQSDLETLATFTEVTNRAAKLGDVTTIDFVGKKDGVAFEGGTGTDYDLELGSKTFIDGFEDGVVGHKISESFDLKLKFPENYGNDELNGQEVVFTVTIKKIKEKNVPKLTVEVLKELGSSATTIEDYKKQVRSDLEKSNKETAETELMNNIWEELIAQCEVVKYKDGAVEAKVEELEQQYYYYAYMSGMETAEFIKAALGMTVEELAKKQITLEYAIVYIAQAEGLELTDDEYKAGLDELAEQYGFESGEKMEESYSPDIIRESLLQDKIGKFLEENCVKVESKK